MATLPDFDITITADTIQAESVKSRPFASSPAINLSFDGKWFPVSIVLKKCTDEQAKKIADAINAVMNGDVVQIIPQE